MLRKARFATETVLYMDILHKCSYQDKQKQTKTKDYLQISSVHDTETLMDSPLASLDPWKPILLVVRSLANTIGQSTVSNTNIVQACKLKQKQEQQSFFGTGNYKLLFLNVHK